MIPVPKRKLSFGEEQDLKRRRDRYHRLMDQHKPARANDPKNYYFPGDRPASMRNPFIVY